MKYETFQKRYKEGIYKEGDMFWVCDLRENKESIIGQYQRKLEPTQVMCKIKETKKKGKELCFYKLKKDGNPSKSIVSIYGPAFQSEPFQIFETEFEAKQEYTKKLKRVFLEINKYFDNFKESCGNVLESILIELKQY